MFQLTKEETANWKSQFVTSNSTEKMGLRYPSYAFKVPIWHLKKWWEKISPIRLYRAWYFDAFIGS
jgi:hypothetical protein